MKQSVEQEFPEGIPPMVEDLLNIALATFSADAMVERDIYLDAKRVESRYNSRKISLVVPVSDKKRWKKVKNKLERTFSFMTYDVFKYKFIKRESDEVEKFTEPAEYDSVALFSGGLDSLGGSYYLRDGGYDPIFVSVNHSGIGKILSSLKSVLPEDSLREVKVNKKRIETSEYTQFSRSFVYLSFATAIALANDIGDIFIPENGIIACQIGLNEGRLSTRTAHPQFLRYFNDLITSLFPEKNLSVENPFTYKTKTEIVEKIEDESKIGKAISCAHRRFLKPKRTEIGPKHCGMGVPCLIRTIALIAANISDGEKLLNLQFNPFMIDFDNPDMEDNAPNPNQAVERRYRDGLVNIMDIAKIAYKIQKKPYEDLATEYPEFFDQDVFEMYKRFSKNTITTLKHFKEKNPTLTKIMRNFNY